MNKNYYIHMQPLFMMEGVYEREIVIMYKTILYLSLGMKITIPCLIRFLRDFLKYYLINTRQLA